MDSSESPSKQLFDRLQERLSRVLELAEKLLKRWDLEEPAPAFFAGNTAFRWDASIGRGSLIPIAQPAGFDLDDLLGVDQVLESLIRNTEQFLSGHPCNHVLLHGDRGTGKSSAVRGILQRFSDRGLRLIEVEKEELVHLPRVLDAIRSGGREYRFIIFCDDLSFGANEAGYREMKAVLDGSISGPPENVCLIVTSNRRQLVAQSVHDNFQAKLDEENELHLGEVLEEKLALADRFGLTLGFYCFNQDTYLEIVENYLAGEGAGPLDEGARSAALRWAQRRGARSGRTARQFVNDWVGRLRVEKQTPRAS